MPLANQPNHREGFMVRLITRARLTQNFAKGLVAEPENPEPAVRKLVESVGAKLTNLYFTTGDRMSCLSAKLTTPRLSSEHC